MILTRLGLTGSWDWRLDVEAQWLLAGARRHTGYGFSVRGGPLARLTEEEVGPVTSIYIALLYCLS